MDEIDQLLGEICFPYAGAELKSARDDVNFRFAHYTSADTAIKIIAGKAIWMRNARVMNDYSEIRYGQKLWEHAWEQATLFKETLNAIDDKIVSAVATKINNSFHDRIHKTYITSLIHHDASNEAPESKDGLLSMWRAYGGETNVAFIFHPQLFLTDAESTNLVISPVLYANQEGFSEQFEKVSNGFEKHQKVLKTLCPDQIVKTLVRAFHFATLATKHPDFKEENEWRVLYSPSLATPDLTESDTVTIDDVPQIIHKINLLPVSKKHPLDTSLSTILDKIIIGPYPNQKNIRDKLLKTLKVAGINDAHDKILISDIPFSRNP